MQQRERERERERKKREKRREKNTTTPKNQNTRPKKEQRKSNFVTSTFCDTLFIFFFSPSLKGERKERRGRFDLHNNAGNAEDTRARKRKRSSTKPHTFLHRNESLFEEEDGKRRFVERDFEKFVKQFVEERPLKRRRLDLKFSLFSLSLYILLS